MWTEKLQTGKYKAVERYTDPVTGKAKKISVVIDSDTRKARKEAQRILDEKIEAILGKTDYDNMTLRELCDRYLESIARPSSRHALATKMKRLCRILDGNARVNGLSALYVSDKLKGQTAYNDIIRELKTLVRFGYANDYIKDKSWIDKLRPQKNDKKEKIENKYLETEELSLLLESMKDRQHWYLLTKFLALSGLRIGEALALLPEDIDTHIHVTKTYLTKINDIGDVPKTADSNRDVFIQAELAEVIAEVKKWRLSYMIKTGIRDERLFPLNYTTFQNYITRKGRAVVPGKTVSPHTLRHTHASLLAESGMSLEAISRRLGHADSKITKEVYLHVTEKVKEREEAQLENIRIL